MKTINPEIKEEKLSTGELTGYEIHTDKMWVSANLTTKSQLKEDGFMKEVPAINIGLPGAMELPEAEAFLEMVTKAVVELRSRTILGEK